MKPIIETLQLSGFLSIREAEIQFHQLNVLVGSNGSGKSNLLRLFEMLQSLADGAFQEYVARAGGANALLHYGRKHTEEIKIQIQFARTEELFNGYYCRLIPAAGDTLLIAEEAIEFHDRRNYPSPYSTGLQTVRAESALSRIDTEFTQQTDKGVAHHVRECLRSYRVYHFHDTSSTARVKGRVYIGDNLSLHADGGNLAAMLRRMWEEHPERYAHLLEFIRLAAPFFGDFVLKPLPGERVLLRWRERGSDEIFAPDALSDGTLRFICLATLLMQPPEWMPATILIDEPELGLHPFAIRLIGEALRGASQHVQLIISTQSPHLLDMFRPDEVLVVERIDGSSQFRRLKPKALEKWLSEYSMGELWEKNLIGGRPPR